MPSSGSAYRLLRALLIALLVLWRPHSSVGQDAGDGDIPRPEVLDDRLEMRLFATEPEIMTPIGLAVGEGDRIFVLESHTHLEPEDYEGPDSDRVKVFIDPDRDGRADSSWVFAEGIDDGMNLAFSPEGVLHVITSTSVFALHDPDGDGRSEEQERLLHLVRPEDPYDHAAMLGITFSRDGWMYVTRGNVGGAAWRMEGTDGSAVSGYGDGGNIMRARLDGSDLEEVATGFWNPFDLIFDRKGRLLAADNDPDSRGPNRLVHIIPGGDYGYKSLYGGSGIHPYLSWDGELPGTLPIAAPLGEAPSGVLGAHRTALPADYEGSVLATIWEERTIVRARLHEEGTSVAGTTETIVQGGHRFRPVALDADSEGAVYVTDWVLRQYPNHGHGRIWRIAAKDAERDLRPRPEFAENAPDPGAERRRELRNAGSDAEAVDRLRRALRSEDPFLRSTAVDRLARPDLRKTAVEATRSEDADVRLGGLLALLESDVSAEQAVPVARDLLDDPDPQVRRMALFWTGRHGLSDLRPEIDAALQTGTATTTLLETYLATVRHLQPEFLEAYRSRAEGEADGIERDLPDGFVAELVASGNLAPAVRALAVRFIEDPGARTDLLVRLTEEGAPPVRREAVRMLGETSSPEAGARLLALATDPDRPSGLRADALLSLTGQPVEAGAEVADLLETEEIAVAVEAARYLRSRGVPGDLQAQITKAYEEARSTPGRAPLAQQLALLTGPQPGPANGGGNESGTEAGEEEAAGATRPTTDAAWMEAVAEGGDPETGRRVFFSRLSQCASCHAFQHRGGDYGPDLSNVGASKSRRQLARSILEPSAQVAPAWQGWFVETADGQRHLGRQVDVQYEGIEIYTQAGEFVHYENVTDYGPLERSLMPDGLERSLTVHDFQSLMAFLEENQ